MTPAFDHEMLVIALERLVDAAQAMARHDDAAWFMIRTARVYNEAKGFLDEIKEHKEDE